jgi:undecaprenyl diphosphate synthase
MAETDSVPRHIAIIPDGNRRYAKKRGMPPWEGHRVGAETFRKTLYWCKDAGIKELTFWAMSTENLERDKIEVEFLFKLLGDLCDEFVKDYGGGKKKDDVRVLFCGALDRLPKSLQEKMKSVMDLTKDNKTYKLNVLVAYGGKEEIVNAARRIAEDVSCGKVECKKIDKDLFRYYLRLDSEPDLIIRTSRQRLSGLLPWQSDYSEIIFLEDLYWPDFSEQTLKSCLKEYSRRIRTFGH